MASEKSQDAAVVMTVNHRFKRGNGDEKIIKDTTEFLEIKKFETTPAVVRRSYGMTLNLSNYESARIDVGVEVPCYVEDIHLADKWAADFCEERVMQEVGKVRGGGKGKDKSKESPI
jgi:hypothetical protein